MARCKVKPEDSIPLDQESGFGPGRNVGSGKLRYERHGCRQVEVVLEGVAKALFEIGIGTVWRLRPLGDAFPQLCQRMIGAAQPLGREVELGAVLRLQHEVAEGKRVESALHQLRDAKEIAGGLRHPRAREQQVPAVHPAADDAMACHAFGLRDLRLVVWEDVVGAAGVDVEALAEQRHGHGRALDVPAGESVAPRARPDLQTVLARRLPQREIARVALARVDLSARAGEQLGGRVP